VNERTFSNSFFTIVFATIKGHILWKLIRTPELPRTTVKTVHLAIGFARMETDSIRVTNVFMTVVEDPFLDVRECWTTLDFLFQTPKTPCKTPLGGDLSPNHVCV
jgi:hypothetical protein